MLRDSREHNSFGREGPPWGLCGPPALPSTAPLPGPRDTLFSLHISKGNPLLFASQKYYSACCTVQR